jgi:hypothetical protein
MSNKYRRKGHLLEQLTVKDLRDLFPKAKTSRNASHLLDSCKIDLAFIPLNIQCKMGYINNRPKWDILKKESDELLKKNYPKNDPIHQNPFLLRHKMGRVDMATMEWKFFLELYKFYVEKNKDKFSMYI